MAYNLNIPGQIVEIELRAIESVALLVPENGVVVEVGSLFGRSSWAWAKSVQPSVQVYCIDPWINNPGIKPIEDRFNIKFGLEQFKEYTADCHNIIPLQGHSPSDFKHWDIPIDLYFEDAVHQNPVFSNNINFWTSHLKPDGIICGHDYGNDFPDIISEVNKLAVELNRRNRTVRSFWCLLPNNQKSCIVQEVDKRLLEIEVEAELFDARKGLHISDTAAKPLGFFLFGGLTWQSRG
jgi:hypothetical protein